MAEGEADEHFKQGIRLDLQREGVELDDQILFHLGSAIELGLSLSDEAEARIFRGSVYKRRGMLSEAKAEIEKALELNERAEKKIGKLSYVDAWTELADIHRESIRFTEAIKCLQRIVEDLPTRYGAEAALGVTMASSCCEIARILITEFGGQQETEQAVSYLQRALQADAEFPDTYLMFGIIFDDKRFRRFYDLGQAKKYYEQYLQRSGSEPWSSEIETAEKRELVQRRLKSLKEETK